MTYTKVSFSKHYIGFKTINVYCDDKYHNTFLILNKDSLSSKLHNIVLLFRFLLNKNASTWHLYLVDTLW